MKKAMILSEIMDSLYEFERIMQSYQSTPHQYGTEDYLYMTETHTIQEIGNLPGQSLTELAEKTFRTESGMSFLLKNLSNKGLILRERDPENNRKYMITLTEKGNIIYNFHRTMDEENYDHFIARLAEKYNYTQDELETTSQFLGDLNHVINNFFRDSSNK